MRPLLQNPTVTMTPTTDLMLCAIANWISREKARRITIEHNRIDGLPSFFTVVLMSNSAMVLHITAPTLDGALTRVRDVLMRESTGARPDQH